MKRKTSLSLGALTAIVIGVIAALTSAGAFAGNNARFHVETSGQGDPVIYIPGLTSSARVFAPFTDNRTGMEHHLITLAGFGAIAAPETMDAFTRPAADALIGYIETENLTGVRLVGHSMGGVISLMIAEALPERVESVLIIDSVPFLAGLRNPAADPESVTAQRGAVRDRFLTMPHDAYLAMMQQGLPVQATSAESQATVWMDIEASDQRAVGIAASEIFNGDYRGLLPDVSAPVTVLVPHNSYMPISTGQLAATYAAQYDGLEHVEVRIIENSRHFIMLDQPDEFAAELDRFLEEAAR